LNALFLYVYLQLCDNWNVWRGRGLFNNAVNCKDYIILVLDEWMNGYGKLMEWYEEEKAKHWWKIKSSCASDLDVSENLVRWWHQYNFMALDDDVVRGARTYFELWTLKWKVVYHAISLDSVKDIGNNLNWVVW
jgi:hypothetical protein